MYSKTWTAVNQALTDVHSRESSPQGCNAGNSKESYANYKGAGRLGIVVKKSAEDPGQKLFGGILFDKDFITPYCHPKLVSGSSCYQTGFTLIELLVVVLIIGILAAVALPQYQKAVTKSKLIQFKTIVESIAKAQEEIYLAKSEYTNDIEALSIGFPPAKEVNTDGARTTLTYPWGRCSMDKTQVSCANEDLGIYYHAYYEHDEHPAEQKRECTAKITMSIPTQVCKQDTGKETPFWNSGTWAAYGY